MPNLRLPNVPAAPAGIAGQAESDKTLLILVGTLAGLALAGLGVTRLAMRGTAAARAANAPPTFVFPPLPETFPPAVAPAVARRPQVVVEPQVVVSAAPRRAYIPDEEVMSLQSTSPTSQP